MKVSSTLWLPVVLLSAFTPAHAAAPAADQGAACTSFMTLVKQTYTFRPSKLSPDERKTKSAAMDQVWEVAKKDPVHIAPCLKTALADPNAQSWFLIDGSSLLLKLDSSKAAKEIYVRNWARADFDDADARAWVETLSAFAADGIDVSDAALNLMAHSFRPYNLPAHAIMIDANGAAFFLLGSMDEAQSRPLLLKILDDPHSTLRSAAAALLLAQATPEAVRDLKKLDTRGLPKQGQDLIKEYLARTKPPLTASKAPSFTRQTFTSALQKSLAGDKQANGEFAALVKKDNWAEDAAAVLTVDDLPALRQVRRYVAARANPHVLAEYQRFTALIETVNQKALAQAR